MTTINNVYAVRDIKSELFAQPHFVPTNGVAIRSFATACEDTNTELNKYPQDYSLYHLGTYNIETGELKSETPKQIANASEFVQSKMATQEDLSKTLEEAKKHLEN